MTAIDFRSSNLQIAGVMEESVAILNIKNFPDSLHRKLKARAKRENRSVAQEVTRILADAVEEPRKLNIMDLEGLGKDLWEGIDAGEYVRKERDSWD